MFSVVDNYDLSSGRFRLVESVSFVEPVEVAAVVVIAFAFAVIVAAVVVVVGAVVVDVDVDVFAFCVLLLIDAVVIGARCITSESTNNERKKSSQWTTTCAKRIRGAASRARLKDDASLATAPPNPFAVAPAFVATLPSDILVLTRHIGLAGSTRTYDVVMATGSSDTGTMRRLPCTIVSCVPQYKNKVIDEKIFEIEHQLPFAKRKTLWIS